jgi:hypothetical protein
MRHQKPILPDENVGGLFVAEDQPVYHLATARLVTRPNDSDPTSTLRFVDHKAALESGFPARLFAAHITALASRERSPVEQERRSRMSLDLFPSGKEDESSDPRDNAIDIRVSNVLYSGPEVYHETIRQPGPVGTTPCPRHRAV